MWSVRSLGAEVFGNLDDRSLDEAGTLEIPSVEEGTLENGTVSRLKDALTNTRHPPV